MQFRSLRTVLPLLALLAGFGIDTFIDNIFNFPTLTESYRVAALDIVKQRVSHGVSAMVTV